MTGTRFARGIAQPMKPSPATAKARGSRMAASGQSSRIKVDQAGFSIPQCRREVRADSAFKAIQG